MMAVTEYKPVSYIDIDTKLSHAFNPDREIRNRTPLEKLLGRKGTSADYLSTEERIVESAMIRRQLLQNLNSTQFKTLQLFYQHFRNADIPLAIELFTPFVRLVISKARLLANNCNIQFAALVCLSTAWNSNLFRLKQWGPSERYYYAVSATRKRRRLNEALEEMRLDAMKQAEKVLQQ